MRCMEPWRDFPGCDIMEGGLVVQECVWKLVGLSFLQRDNEMPDPLFAADVPEDKRLANRVREKA